MGFVYVGGKTNQHINGYMKIGETNQQYLSTRIAQIRASEGNFTVFKYIEVPNSTKAITRAIEGHTRMMLERDGWKNVQNDHFIASVNKNTRESIYQAFTNRAIEHMVNYCNTYGIQYMVKDDKTELKKTVKRKSKG